MPQCATRFKTELRTLQHCAEERFLIALHQSRNLSAFRHHDAGEAFGRHALWKGKRHLRLEGLAAHDSSMVPVLLVAATAEARALAGATVRFSCSVVLMVESPKLSYAESRKTRDSEVLTYAA